MAPKEPVRTNLRGADAEVLQIVALQSRDTDRIRRVLDPRNPIGASLLPYVIALLGDRGTAGIAFHALQLVADRHGGALVDALLDPSRSPVVRRRLARVLSVCRSQAVVDGLLDAVEDPHADVRAQCGRSLLRIRRRSAHLHVGGDRVFDLVRRELDRDHPDLRHVFTLLSCELPMQPLRAAWRGLRSDDRYARGTALEYLHALLPTDVGVALLKRFERPDGR